MSNGKSAGLIKILLLVILTIALLTYWQIDLRQFMDDLWQKFAN